MYRPLVDLREAQTRRATYDTGAGADEQVFVGDLCVAIDGGQVTVDSDNAGAAVIADNDRLAGVVIGWSGPDGEVVGFGSDPNVAARPSIVIPDGNADGVQLIYIPITRNLELEGLLDDDSGTTGNSAFGNRFFQMATASLIDESEHNQDPAGLRKVFSLGLMPGEAVGSRRVRVKIRRAVDLA